MTVRTADARAALPPPLAEALAGYEDHLRTQRDLSEHTVRGYVGDAVRLLDHLVRRGGTRVDDSGGQSTTGQSTITISAA